MTSQEKPPAVPHVCDIHFNDHVLLGVLSSGRCPTRDTCAGVIFTVVRDSKDRLLYLVGDTVQQAQ